MPHTCHAIPPLVLNHDDSRGIETVGDLRLRKCGGHRSVLLSNGSDLLGGIKDRYRSHRGMDVWTAGVGSVSQPCLPPLREWGGTMAGIR